MIQILRNEDSDEEDRTIGEFSDELGSPAEKDIPAAMILNNPRDVKEHFNREQRRQPCPPPDHLLIHFPEWPFKGGNM